MFGVCVPNVAIVACFCLVCVFLMMLLLLCDFGVLGVENKRLMFILFCYCVCVLCCCGCLFVCLVVVCVVLCVSACFECAFCVY